MRASAWAAILVGLLASQSASGAILRIDFAGSVSTIQGSTMSQADAEAALGDSIHIGTPFSGYMLIDDAASPYDYTLASPGYAASASYSFAPPYVVHTELGGYSSDTNGSRVRVYDAEESGQVTHVLVDGTDAPPVDLGNGWLLLDAVVALYPNLYDDPLLDTDLRNVPWNLTTFPNSDASWSIGPNGDPFGSNQIFVGGSLTSLSAQVVPEAAASSLVALAAAALAALGYRRGRS